MPPTPPPPIPDLLRQASHRLEELASRADRLAEAGTNSSHDPNIAQAMKLARQLLEIPSPAQSQ